MAKLTKAQAGSLGGKATVKKYGLEYMKKLAALGALATWTKYSLQPLGTNKFVMVERATGLPIGKNISM